MKFRVIFLKKKHMYYAIASAVFLTLLILLLLTRGPSPTFSTVGENRTINAELTGDGKEDVLYVKVDKSKYAIEVNTQDKSFNLETDKKLNTLGSYDPFNPLKVILVDVSRDKTPEIFVQSSQDSTPIQHAFIWNNGKFEDMFCSSNNILGFMDCSNNKTPKVLSGKINGNKIDLTNYIFLKNRLESFTFKSTDNLMGKDSMLSFIKYIEGLPNGEANMPKDIFYPGLTGKDLAIIGKLAGENNTYIFQNAVFKDNKSDKEGAISEVKWTICLKGKSNIDPSKVTNYTLNVLLRPYAKSTDSFYFRIYSISLE